MIPASEERPIKILDLACGLGPARVPTAKRYAGREVHYVGVDEERPRGREVLKWTARFSRIPPERRARFTEEFRPAYLDFHSPERLKEALQRVVGGEKFDEIHLHALPAAESAAHDRGPETLKVIAALLKKGGRFYHMFEGSSPLLDLVPKTFGRDAARTSEDLRRIREAAAGAGLVVDRFGGRSAATGYKWAGAGMRGSAERAGDAYELLAKDYSDFGASHFIIFRKPAR